MENTTMAPIVIPLPGRYHYSTQTGIRITDINYAGHLGNDSVLSIIHEARMRFFKHYRYSEDNVEGVNTIMNNAAIQYKSQGFYGNRLLIEMAATDFHAYGFDIIYRLTNSHNGKEIARARTGIVFFDYRQRKMQPVPEAFKKLFETDGKLVRD
jgi:acyl-CoA thioesterase FadM